MPANQSAGADQVLSYEGSTSGSLQHVRIVGTGLLGASLGLALRARGVEVTLSDPSPVAVALASDMGAGHPAANLGETHEVTQQASPDLVVVAAPPDVVAEVIRAALACWPHATVTDVASVKARIADQVLRDDDARARYVPGHPMAGRERSGAVAAQADLFESRTWVLCPGADAARFALVEQMARSVGANVVKMHPHEHDEAVAAVSHLPQIAASLVAGQLRELPEASVSLCGQGVRDVTRIAASDPMLWTQILSGNAAAMVPLLESVEEQLHALRLALSTVDESRVGAEVTEAADALWLQETENPLHRMGQAAGDQGPLAVIARSIALGQEGHARIPGKHGKPATLYATVAVVIPDEPGSLGRVFQHVGQSGVSVEDVRIEHDSARNVGVLELDVLPVRAAALRAELSRLGWKVHILEAS